MFFAMTDIVPWFECFGDRTVSYPADCRVVLNNGGPFDVLIMHVVCPKCGHMEEVTAAVQVISREQFLALT
jgi:hypothetical protein